MRNRAKPSKDRIKEELEREKLLLEIEEFKKRWWKKPSYIAALFPTILALLTLIYGFANGYFQASFTKLENQKHDLQKEIEVFTEQKNKIEGQVVELAQQLEDARETISKAEIIRHHTMRMYVVVAKQKEKCEEELGKLKKHK